MHTVCFHFDLGILDRTCTNSKRRMAEECFYILSLKHGIVTVTFFLFRSRLFVVRETAARKHNRGSIFFCTSKNWVSNDTSKAMNRLEVRLSNSDTHRNERKLSMREDSSPWSILLLFSLENGERSGC
jgi:hypothetical protein